MNGTWIRQIKLAAVADVASLYGVPMLTPYLEESIGPENLTDTSSPDMDAQKTRSSVRQAFETNARIDQSGSSQEPVSGLTQS